MDQYLLLKTTILNEVDAVKDYVKENNIRKDVETLSENLLRNKRLGLLEEFFLILYDRILQVQEIDCKRYHKGDPLYKIGIARHMMGYPGADRFVLLAYIEDCISYFQDNKPENTPENFPAYLFLKYTLKVSDLDLVDVKNKIDEVYLYPEEVFNSIARDVWLVNDVLFDINKVYYNSLLSNLEDVSYEYKNASRSDKNKLATKVGRTFEDFCHYLFNSVNGFKVISKNVNTGVNEIDRIVENYSSNPLLKKLGKYILIECKNSSWRTQNSRPGSKVFDHLLMTMRRANCQTGILISKSGFTKTVRDAAYLEFLKSDSMVLLLDFSDLTRIGMGENLVNVLLEKYNELKFFKL